MHSIITVTQKSLPLYPQVICFINPKHPCHGLKIEWLKKRFKEGLVIKVLQASGEKGIAGFMEYVPGEYAWRGVSARDYLFIHCLWVSPNKNRRHGLGSRLIEEVVADAKAKKMRGVAVVTSDGSFMAKIELFLENGFELIDEQEDFQLLVKRFARAGVPPSLIDARSARGKLVGWHMVYSRQCPWVARFVEEVKPIIKKAGIRVSVKELTVAKQAQQAPSLYSCFALIRDGRLLADRYISTTRFSNILRKETGTRGKAIDSSKGA